MIKKPETLSLGTAVSSAAQRLRESAVANPRRDAQSLLAHVLGRDQTFVVTRADDVFQPQEYEAFRSLIERRAGGEPLQYLTGHQEFYKLDFEVTPAVLIPRPETELIVETALELLRDKLESNIADVGTGTGCLAISILHELPRARAVAIDSSRGALQVAQRNAERHGVTDRLTLLESDCFSALDKDLRFGIIVSNPPYVSEDEMRNLQREVSYEPRDALAAGPDGLTMIRRLILEARPFLGPGGYFVFEIGFGQSEAVQKLIDPRMWKTVEILTDLQKIPRTFVLQGK